MSYTLISAFPLEDKLENDIDLLQMSRTVGLSKNFNQVCLAIPVAISQLKCAGHVLGSLCI